MKIQRIFSAYDMPIPVRIQIFPEGKIKIKGYQAFLVNEEGEHIKLS